jgi:hypothetical protein
MSDMMLEEGLEPSRGCPHRILSPARLPIPPLEPVAPMRYRRPDRPAVPTIVAGMLRALRLPFRHPGVTSAAGNLIDPRHAAWSAIAPRNPAALPLR